MVKYKLIIYPAITIVLFLLTTLFIKQCQIEKLQRENAKFDYEEFQEDYIKMNREFRESKIKNLKLSKELNKLEVKRVKIEEENTKTNKQLKIKTQELKESKTVEGKLKISTELIEVYKKDKKELQSKIVILKDEKKKLQEKYVNLKVDYDKLFKNNENLKEKYGDLYKLKFKPDKKYKYIIIGETVLFIAYLFLKK